MFNVCINLNLDSTYERKHDICLPSLASFHPFSYKCHDLIPFYIWRQLYGVDSPMFSLSVCWWLFDPISYLLGISSSEPRCVRISGACWLRLLEVWLDCMGSFRSYQFIFLRVNKDPSFPPSWPAFIVICLLGDTTRVTWNLKVILIFFPDG